ncbi:hypothetical protein [Streptomyces sp. NPDC001816]|uniref:hypothetical protein n=1 Tax=Streptomyces sp. NPDC001816 TaxID=3364612 RepID=UPI00367F21C4
MRVLPVRRLASTTLCAALLVGIAGPAAVAADSARERTHAGSHSAVPGADALLSQVRSLRNVDPRSTRSSTCSTSPFRGAD